MSNLNRRVNILRTSICNNVTIKGKPKLIIPKGGKSIGFYLGSTSIRINPAPLIISILIGEIVYNLRSALDYLVYELARLDSQKIIDGTQFPIEDMKERFRGRRNSFLKGLSDEHVTLIEGLQPYNRCDWTRILRDLSNPDKHRHLTIPQSSVGISFPNPFQNSTKSIAPSHTMHVNPKLSTGIQFRSGKTIITVEILKQLKLQVTQTLDAFKSEFK